MPAIKPTFELVEKLESQWCPPPSPVRDGSQPKDWKPLPDGTYSDWTPLEETWEMPEILRRTRNNNETAKPLSDECVEKLGTHWQGKQVQPSGTANASAHYFCYPITNHPAWGDWRNHSAFRGQEMWWCSSLKNAADHYSWTTYSGGSFEQLAAALQSAIRRPDATLAAVVCLKILDWGGVRKGPRESTNTIEWLKAALNNDTLLADLERAASLLCPQSNGNLAVFFGKPYPKFPMNSGSTKIFSAVAMDFSAGLDAPKQDVLIFDGRVSTGLGFIARELSCPEPVPRQFLFPYDDANKKRNPRCLNCAKFPRMSTRKDVARAEYARIASRCIQQVLNQYRPSADFVSAEKALFMIGYDVQKTCSGPREACRTGTGNARPSTPQRQSLASAPKASASHTAARSSRTLSRNIEFSYSGTPASGTRLTFGSNNNADISAQEYANLRAHFRGMQVVIGASRTTPPIGSLGAWLVANLAGRPAIASYVAPILIDAGWAAKVDKQTIQFQ